MTVSYFVQFFKFYVNFDQLNDNYQFCIKNSSIYYTSSFTLVVHNWYEFESSYVHPWCFYGFANTVKTCLNLCELAQYGNDKTLYELTSFSNSYAKCTLYTNEFINLYKLPKLVRLKKRSVHREGLKSTKRQKNSRKINKHPKKSHRTKQNQKLPKDKSNVQCWYADCVSDAEQNIDSSVCVLVHFWFSLVPCDFFWFLCFFPSFGTY